MTKHSDDYRVFIKKVGEYDRSEIARAVSEGMEALGYKPQGKVFVKPNVVVANKPDKYGITAYTHPDLVRAALGEIAKTPDVSRIDIGENSAIGFPTRVNYKFAGYYGMAEETRKEIPCPLGLSCMDEEARDEVFIGGKVHDTLRLARSLSRADTKVYMPKLKCHCVANVTATVKLNVGICGDDERSIRHDFLLDDKIVDLLAAGYPDFIIMDAIDVGVGNEGFPEPRRLGVMLMAKNPLAADLVGARLLGFSLDDVPYLKRAAERGYRPGSVGEVKIIGDLNSLADVDEQAKNIQPYDDDFHKWTDIGKELERLGSPMKFLWGPYGDESDDLCKTGCVMGLKMFLATFEAYAGPDVFKSAWPVTFVIGRQDAPVDGRGEEVFMIGKCARAEVVNAKKVTRIDKCFTTVSDMSMVFGHRLGMPAFIRDFDFVKPLGENILLAHAQKWKSLRMVQDIARFATGGLLRKF